MKQVFTYQDFKRLRDLSFEQKVRRATCLTRDECRSHSNPAIACSFGKDSMVILHLVLQQVKNPIVIFHNTGVQYPEMYRFRDRIVKEWALKNFYETKPAISFWTCVKRFGYPHFRRAHDRAPKCCWHLKEKPARHFIKDMKIDLEFNGLQASESMMRRLSFFREGEAYDSVRYGCRMVRPLMIWTDKDVWKYHKLHEIPINPIYQKMRRNGCMTCTGFKGWRRQLAKTNPKLYRFISHDLGQSLISDFGCAGDYGFSVEGEKP